MLAFIFSLFFLLSSSWQLLTVGQPTTPTDFNQAHQGCVSAVWYWDQTLTSHGFPSFWRVWFRGQPMPYGYSDDGVLTVHTMEAGEAYWVSFRCPEDER